MPYYRNHRYEEYDAEVNRLPSGLFFTAARVEHMEPPANTPHNDIKQKEAINHEEINYQNFVVPKYNSTKTGKEVYLPLLEVSIEVDVVATIAWSKLTQTFTNRSKQPIKEATYCMPLYDKSTVTSFVCTIGSDKVLKGTVKPKEKAKAEFKEAVAKQQVAALLEEHTPEVFETTVGNIPAETTVKVEISYITELKADLGGDGVLVTIPTSVAPRYGAVPSTMGENAAKSLAVPEKNGLQIKIQVSSPVAITKIESRTHPVSIEMGSHGTRVTKDIRDFSKKQESRGFDPKKAAATLSDRNACLGKDFVLLIQANDRQLLASRAISEPHPKIPDRSALMVSINLRDFYTPNVVAPKTSSEIIFVADRSCSMGRCMEALKTAMKFFLKSLPNNCIFNICSFGNRHELMWPKSQPYNQETVDAALSYVANHFSADMGGTEIERAVRHVVERSEISVNTEIIILTDGEVWDALSLFHFIEKTRSSLPNQDTRFFCLGIGEAVSHHLVAGIGRYGGGLAEVVATDSTGDWMQRVIGMLRAALTPSSWTVDVTLDGVSISENKSEDNRCIQAPHQIPNFHAFSRSSVYFLLNKEFKGEVVKIKAKSVYSGETFTAEIPIEKSDIGRKWVHQLAAKAVLGDFESGRSWIHDKSRNSTDLKAKAEADELAKIEGEKIGIEWNISSKWTSFIVVDEQSLLEKQSRWYQAGHSDLAELTRPRFEPKYNTRALGADPGEDQRIRQSFSSYSIQGATQNHTNASRPSTPPFGNSGGAPESLGAWSWGASRSDVRPGPLEVYSSRSGESSSTLCLGEEDICKGMRKTHSSLETAPHPPRMSAYSRSGGLDEYETGRRQPQPQPQGQSSSTTEPGSSGNAFRMLAALNTRGTSEPSSDTEDPPVPASYDACDSADDSDGVILGDSPPPRSPVAISQRQAVSMRYQSYLGGDPRPLSEIYPAVPGETERNPRIAQPQPQPPPPPSNTDDPPVLTFQFHYVLDNSDESDGNIAMGKPDALPIDYLGFQGTNEDSQQYNPEPGQATSQDDVFSDDSKQDLASMERGLITDSRSPRHYPPSPPQPYSYDPSQYGHPSARSPSPSRPHPRESSGPRTPPPFRPGRVAHDGARSRSRSWSRQNGLAASRDAPAETTIPFAIPLHPTPEIYRSQSYSVGQLDPESSVPSASILPGPIFNDCGSGQAYVSGGGSYSIGVGSNYDPTPETYRSQSYSVGQLDPESNVSGASILPGPIFNNRGSGQAYVSGGGGYSSSSSINYDPPAQPPSPLTLTDLLTTQHTLGYFLLTPSLSLQLTAQYKLQSTALHIDDLLAPHAPNRSEYLLLRPQLLATVMAVAYIEAVCAADWKLWDLVVQKARAWLAGVLPDPELWGGVWGKARALLLGPGDEGAAADRR